MKLAELFEVKMDPTRSMKLYVQDAYGNGLERTPVKPGQMIVGPDGEELGFNHVVDMKNIMVSDGSRDYKLAVSKIDAKILPADQKPEGKEFVSEAQDTLEGASLVLATITVDFEDDEGAAAHQVIKVYWSAKDMDDAKEQAESINDLVDPQYDLDEAPWLKKIMRKVTGDDFDIRRLEFSKAKAVKTVPSSAFEIPKQDF